MSVNIKLMMEFDGTAYHGWQKQASHISIQEVLEQKVEQITGSHIRITGSGRTDSGVHAMGYVANFASDNKMSADAWQMALNSLLPDDMVVTGVEIVGDDFNARFSAKAKIYNYFILNKKHGSPLYNRYAWLVKYPLDIKKMIRACPYFEGENDFTSFTVARSAEGKNNRCMVFYVRIRKRKDLIFISIKGDRFLHHMVRNIVGTLVAVGRGSILCEDLKNIFEAKDRSCAGETAPAKGLFLKRVYY